MSDREELEALRRVTREAREDAGPELDWDRVEARLLERIDASESTGSPRAARNWRIMGTLALAAVIALIVGALVRGGGTQVAQNQENQESAARVFGASGNVDGATLRQGDQIVAVGHAVVVDHPGRARWTLETSGHALVAETGEHLSIALESGAVSAEVVPSPRPETFAIEVAGARVAVHGTAFRVERRADGLRVVVNEGVVAVGPAGQRGHTQGWLLRHGDSGEFSLDGTRGSVNHTETAALEPQEPTPAAKARANVRPSLPNALPASPSATELAQGMSRIEAAVRGCYDHNAPSPEKGVRVRVDTELRAIVAADGNLQELGFDPPLPPAVDACVTSETANIRFPASQEGATTKRSLMLGS